MVRPKKSPSTEIKLDLNNAEGQQLASQIMTARYRCRTDLWYLCRNVLGFVDMARMHADLIDILEDTRLGHLQRLFLLPRGHLKSTIITIGDTIQLILRTYGEFTQLERDKIPEAGQEWNIGVGSWDTRTAEKHIHGIKTQFERNKTLKTLFPDIVWQDGEKPPTWGKDALDLKRSHSAEIKSITAFTCESPPTGFHFHKLKIDDMVTQENVRSARSLDVTAERFADLDNLKRSTDDTVDFIGTRCHRHDIYAKLLQTPDTYSYVRACVEGPDGKPADVIKDKDAKPIWPQRYSIRGLKAQLAKDMHVFAAQMMNDPLRESVDRFNVENFERYDSAECPNPRELSIVIRIDPARSTKDRADYTAVMVVGYDSLERIWVLDGLRDRLPVETWATPVSKIIRKWAEVNGVLQDNVDVAIEDDANGVWAANALRLEGIGYVGTYSNKGKKVDKIKRIAAPLKRGRIRIPRDGLHKEARDGTLYDVIRELEIELSHFPHSIHDDLSDALAQCVTDDAEMSEEEESELKYDNIANAEDHAQWDRDHFGGNQGGSGEDGLFGDFSRFI